MRRQASVLREIIAPENDEQRPIQTATVATGRRGEGEHERQGQDPSITLTLLRDSATRGRKERMLKQQHLGGTGTPATATSTAYGRAVIIYSAL